MSGWPYRSLLKIAAGGFGSLSFDRSISLVFSYVALPVSAKYASAFQSVSAMSAPPALIRIAFAGGGGGGGGVSLLPPPPPQASRTAAARTPIIFRSRCTVPSLADVRVRARRLPHSRAGSESILHAAGDDSRPRRAESVQSPGCRARESPTPGGARSPRPARAARCRSAPP